MTASLKSPSPYSVKIARTASVDLDTGEIIPGTSTVYRTNRSPRYISEDYMIAFSAAFEAASEDRDLGLQEWRVLARLISMLPIGSANEWKSINISDLGASLGMKRQNVSAALKVLVENEIVIRGCRIGRGHAYSLNPNFGWKGPARLWPDASKSAPKLKLVSSR